MHYRIKNKTTGVISHRIDRLVICPLWSHCPEICEHKLSHVPQNDCNDERTLCHNRLLHDEHGVKCESI